MHRFGPALITLILALGASPAIAQDSAIWTGQTSEDWTVVTNWLSNQPPTANSDVFIGGNSFSDSAVIGFNGTPVSAVAHSFILGQSAGQGLLTVQAGSTLTTGAGGNVIGSLFAGTVTVTDANSVWTSAGPVSLGGGPAPGTLIIGGSGIDAGGAVSINNSLTVGESSSGGAGFVTVTNGTLAIGSMLKGYGTAVVSLTDSTLQALADNSAWLTAFVPGDQLAVDVEGTVTVDTQQFTVGTPGAIFTGNGTLTKTGTGTLILNEDSTYRDSGPTTVAAGTLQLGDGGVTGSIATDVVLQGSSTLAFNRSGTYQFGQAISGTGGVSQIGSGTTVLFGALSYTGPTSVYAGTLELESPVTSNSTVYGGALVVDTTATGSVSVQGPGTLGGSGTIVGDVTNAGTVAPSYGLPELYGQALTINGNYFGNSGAGLDLKAKLAGDNTVTDKLLITGANHSASGVTGITVTNVGGAGAQTTGNGIPVVVAQDLATTAPGAFFLAAQVAAGPFQYLLFQGGVGDPYTWFLRSCEGTGCGGPNPTPFYRPETTIYGTLPLMARALGIATVGTFHERNGDQDVARDGSGRAWGRIFGEHNEQGSSGQLNSRFDGWLGGVQLGIDAFRVRGDDGAQDAGGFFFALANAQGDVNGHAIGIAGADAGSSDLSGPSFGAYYTHIGAGSSWYGNWYFDALAMQTFYEADGKSTGGTRTNVGGSGTFLSLEAGVPLPLGFGGLFIEPEGQLIYQRLDFGGATDQFSTVAFDSADVLTGRLGLRLGLDLDPTWRPYLKANLWQDWAGTDRTIYASTHALSSTDDSTALELGGGLVGALSDTLAVWGVVDYTTDVADNDVEIIRGNLGLKVGW